MYLFSHIVGGGAYDAPCQASDPVCGPSKAPAPTRFIATEQIHFHLKTTKKTGDAVFASPSSVRRDGGGICLRQIAFVPNAGRPMTAPTAFPSAPARREASPDASCRRPGGVIACGNDRSDVDIAPYRGDGFFAALRMTGGRNARQRRTVRATGPADCQNATARCRMKGQGARTAKCRPYRS